MNTTCSHLARLILSGCAGALEADICLDYYDEEHLALGVPIRLSQGKIACALYLDLQGFRCNLPRSVPWQSRSLAALGVSCVVMHVADHCAHQHALPIYFRCSRAAVLDR